jgi:hypothetical protein
MANDKLKQLSHVHFEQQLWHKELEMIENESIFFLKLLETLQTEQLIASKNEKTVGEYLNRIHHFQRITKRLSEELHSIEKEMAEGVIQDNVLDKEQRLDHQYFREEMDYLEQDYRNFKSNLKTFIATSHFGRN